MKRTGWYRGDQKPVRVGVYERKYPSGNWYCYWDGRAFRIGCFSLSLAADIRNDVTEHQNLPWRGLAKEPK